MQWCFKYAAKSKLEWDSYCGRVSDTEEDRLSLRPSSSPAVALSLSSVVSVTAAVSFLDGGRWCYMLNVMCAVMWWQNMENARASQAAITTEQIQSVHRMHWCGNKNGWKKKKKKTTFLYYCNQPPV